MMRNTNCLRTKLFRIIKRLFAIYLPLEKTERLKHMKVLIVNHFPLTGSGSGAYTTNIANSLVKLGHEVCAVYPDNAPESSDWLFKTHPVYFKSETHSLIKPEVNFNFPCFTTHPRSTMTFDNMTDGQFSDYMNALKAAIASEVENFKPDIIHCGHIWLLANLATEFSIPVVITCHGTDLMGIKSCARFRKYALEAAEKCSAIVAISNGNLNELNKVLPQFKSKFHLIPNGFNSSVFYPEACSTKSVLKMFEIEKPYSKIISFAGKFAHFKGIDVLLRANALYARDDTATILAGDGELFEEMSKLKTDLQLNDTYFVHNQPHDVLRKLYSAAEVSLVPSRNEPFGLVAIEAGACGAPVIASESGGLIDIVVPKTGMFFEQDNAEELAKCVSSVLNGEVSFSREEVAAKTLETFGQDAFTQRLIDEVYAKAVK